ncbi:nicotinamide riboside transporter PnuC [Piscinibacter sakaiensis]|uniref:nicotinamide riboside transporter PnuC n=1 Tax=Piscinibacter sakaiensis TaxID=1547922 RepID=UPI003AABA727
MVESWLIPLQPLLVPAFTAWGSPVTWLEIVAFVLALVMVGCNMRVNPLAWPLAIVSSALYAALFLDSRLYGEAGLQLVFITVAFWGWWQWLRGTTDSGAPLRVRWLEPRKRWALLATMAVAWPALALLLATYTDSDVPWFDAFPTAGSLLGQWLLGRKYVENWLAWLIVNIVSVALFVHKGLWLTVLLYALFVVLSVLGWLAWRRLANNQPTAAIAAEQRLA